MKNKPRLDLNHRFRFYTRLQFVHRFNFCLSDLVKQYPGRFLVCMLLLNMFSSLFIMQPIQLFIFLMFNFLLGLRGHSFFHPHHNGQWPPTSTDFYTRSYPLHYFLILILEKEPVFPFSMLSAKQGNYWYHFYNVFGMTWSLTGDWTRDLPHSKPALYH